MHYQICDYRKEDAEGVLEVFNGFVLGSFAAYPTEPVGTEFTNLLETISARFPVAVVKDAGKRVIGFGLLRPFHPAGSFRRTAEIGYFLEPGCTGRGVGTALLQFLLDKGRAMGLHAILASISSRNEQSLAFHRRHGFEEVGRFREIGEKFGVAFDVVYMQRSIAPLAAPVGESDQSAGC